MALVITLLVTAILVTLVTDQVYRMYVNLNRAANVRAAERASVMASSGVDMARRVTRRVLSNVPYLTMDPGGMEFSRTESGITTDVTLTDERSRLSVDIVYPATGVEIKRAFGPYSRLLEDRGHDEMLVETLADWIDGDDEPRPYGAEGPGHYRNLTAPYRPTNNYPETLEELLLVKGYTRDVYNDIAPFVTVHTDGLVNINTAPVEVIKALSEDVTREMAEAVVEKRKETPFKDKSDILNVPGFDTVGIELQDKITVSSDIYRVTVRATSEEVVRVVEAVFDLNGKIHFWREF